MPSDPHAWHPPPSARQEVEQRLEAGEPIEAFVRVAFTGLTADPHATQAVGATAALTFSRPAMAYLSRTTVLAVTDRRVFFISEPSRMRVRVEAKVAVRVLEYDSTVSPLRVWLNVDGHQIGYRVPSHFRAAADALVHSLGGAPPSLTRTPDR